MFRTLGNSALGKILSHMSRARRAQLYLLLALLFLGAIAELTAIAAVVPFLSLLAGSSIERVQPAHVLFGWLGVSSADERLLAATTLFAIAAVIAGTLRIALTWITQSFSFGLGHDLATEIQAKLLYQPYAFHTAGNSSDFVSTHEKVFAFIHGTLLPALNGLTAAITSLFIVAILAYIAPVPTGIAAGAVAAIYLAVSWFTRERLHRYGFIISSTHSKRVRTVQESLGGIRDVILDNSQPVHLAQFERISRDYSRAELMAAFVGATPRYAIEAAGMVLIALFAVALSRNGGFAAALPLLGAMALSAQRLLPLLQQVYQGWAQLRTGSASASELAKLLDLRGPQSSPVEAEIDPLPLDREIRFTKVSFHYPGRADQALNEIDLRIERGSRVALVGPTGSGKSTLLDILMGLLDPTAGSLTVDGISPSGDKRSVWRLQIAHVPQSIFLADTTIARNIAFSAGKDDVDFARIRWAAQLAQAESFIDALPDRFETRVGERGVRLSGGQRQRIGIARALYKRAPILILDEATSALDLETEAAIMEGLESLGDQVTIVMVAHRLPAVAHFETIIRLERGTVKISGQPVKQKERARIFS
jgi:ABC-type multidrug transport system fused ATPase/permease subunit